MAFHVKPLQSIKNFYSLNDTTSQYYRSPILYNNAKIAKNIQQFNICEDDTTKTELIKTNTAELLKQSKKLDTRQVSLSTMPFLSGIPLITVGAIGLAIGILTANPVLIGIKVGILTAGLIIRLIAVKKTTSTHRGNNQKSNSTPLINTTIDWRTILQITQAQSNI